MPTLKTSIGDTNIEVELNHSGEIEGVYAGNKKLDLFAVLEETLHNEITECMEEYYREVREYKKARGRDRLGE